MTARREDAGTAVLDLARNMALAIMRDRVARSSSTVGRDGRQRVTYQHMQAYKQMDDAMEAFCEAVGMTIEKPTQYTDAEALKIWSGLEMPVLPEERPDDLFARTPAGTF